MAELFPLSNLARILQELAQEVEAVYKDNLRQSGREASGDLLRSISADVEVKGTRYTAYLNLADYWKYVEHDTKPHWPPPEAIARWVFIKPVIPRPDAKGHIPTPAQLTFLIGRKISEVGTKGSHDLERAEGTVLPKYTERLKEALGRDTLEYIHKLLD